MNVPVGNSIGLKLRVLKWKSGYFFKKWIFFEKCGSWYFGKMNILQKEYFWKNGCFWESRGFWNEFRKMDIFTKMDFFGKMMFLKKWILLQKGFFWKNDVFLKFPEKWIFLKWQLRKVYIFWKKWIFLTEKESVYFSKMYTFDFLMFQIFFSSLRQWIEVYLKL